MVYYLRRKAKKKAEYPLSPQHNRVTSVYTDIILAVFAAVCRIDCRVDIMSLDFLFSLCSRTMKEIQDDGGIRQLAI